MEENTFELTLLYDFFGELLTEKQREFFEYYYSEDLSVSEIAEIAGVSRAGAYETVARARERLIDIEAKTGVVARFREMTGRIDGLMAQVRELKEIPDERAARIADRLLLELERLKG